MPQASHQLRGLMHDWFGDPISDYGPMKFLQSHGYVLRQDWFWEKPVPSHTISEAEWHCLRFLIDEWDFGGIYQNGKHPEALEIGDDAFISHV